ncbi:MAG TPA: Wzz/FepE/Etk N-terminal domain-containing protein, partial [Gammaproteobacteria bacterium]
MNAVPRIDVKDGYESVDTDPGQGLSDIFGAIRRRWKFLLTTVIVSLALAYALMALLTPRYTADARVLIEAEGRNLVSVEAVVPMLQADDTLVQSEAMVLSSRILATRVIQQLNLDEDPEFNPELRRSSTDESGAAAGDTSARAVDGFIESVLSIFGSEGQSTTQSSFVDLTDSIVIDRFLRRLRVLPIENSRVLSVTFSSEDPVKAAMIANLVVDEYIAFRVDAKLDTTRRAAGWVDEQVAELQALVAENEAAVERARQEYGLQETGGVTLASRELDSLDAQLFQARSQRTELRGRLSQVESLIESSADLDTAVEVLDSSLIQN